MVTGGTANVTANDDGVNASGGSSTATTGGGMGGGEMAVGDYTVEISGGSLTINAQGDGLDSNGNASISGGTVVVNGPTNSGNGALDVNGELTVTGGTVAAAGSAGMVVTPGTSSTQSGVQVTLGSTVPAGTVVQIADSAGTVVGAFVTTKATASLVFSSAAITEGEEYTVYTGGTATVSAGIGEGSLDGADQVRHRHRRRVHRRGHGRRRRLRRPPLAPLPTLSHLPQVFPRRSLTYRRFFPDALSLNADIWRTLSHSSQESERGSADFLHQVRER